MAIASNHVSLAPAGHKYTSIEDAGKGLLKQNCPGFPSTACSYMLPPLFQAHFPEARERATSQPVRNPLLSTAQEGRFIGIMTNQSGEQAEYAVFSALQTLIAEDLKEPLLVLRNFNLDMDNRKEIRRKALQKELPKLDLRGVKTNDERDFIVLVQNLGVVLMEVKKSINRNILAKAEKQLHEGKRFVCSLMDAVTGGKPSNLPCLKMVIVPDDHTPSHASKTIAKGSHVISKDMLRNFRETWSDVIKDLTRIKTANVLSPISSSDFERFTRLMVGIWSMKPMYSKTKFDFDSARACLPCNVETIGTMVDHAQLGSRKSDHELPLTDVAHVKKGDPLRQAKNITLLYLTPSQKDLYDNVPRAIIRGHAGTGKSLLILFKIMEIMTTQPHAKILLLAPHPHHIRCRNILESNNVNAIILKEFPSKPTVSAAAMAFFNISDSVIIMKLRDFFGVPENRLNSYDVSDYHIFIDDLQSCRLDKNENESKISYDDIFNFIESTYRTSRLKDLSLWCAFDAVQSINFTDCSKFKVSRAMCSIFAVNAFKHANASSHSDSDNYTTNNNNDDPERLLYAANGARKGSLCSINDVKLKKSRDPNVDKALVPVYILEEVLRNSKEIGDYTIDIRDEKVKYCTRTIENVVVGHSITSTPVTVHKLCTDTEPKYCEKFVLERVEEEVKNIMSKPCSLQPSQVAILHGHGTDYTQPLQQMLFKSFQLDTQTIEGLLTGSDNDDVLVFDRVENVMSFESQSVIYINYNEYGVHARDEYIMASRARARLVVIQPHVKESSISKHNHSVIINWKEVNGELSKM